MNEMIDFSKFDEYCEKMKILFIGMEDGWIAPNIESIELFSAFTKWIDSIEKDKEKDQ